MLISVFCAFLIFRHRHMSRAVSDTDEIVVMTAAGIVMRTRVSEIRIIGRGTKGVRVVRLDENDKVVGVAIVQQEENGDDTDSAPSPENGKSPE